VVGAEKAKRPPEWEVVAHAAGLGRVRYWRITTRALREVPVLVRMRDSQPRGHRNSQVVHVESVTYSRRMRVVEIWRYPVKSLGGEQLTSADVGPDGIVGDRMWGLRDRSTGLVLTARREPALLFLTAEHRDADRPFVTDELGAELGDDDALSERLGRSVELVSALDGPGTFENPMNVDDDTDWIQWQSAGRTFHDGRSTVSLVSTGSVGAWDRRRFRANVIVETSTDADLLEVARIGPVGITIRKPIDRCVMVTRAQPGLERDLQVLKHIIAERGNQLAVGATVSTPGAISVGDAVG